MVPARIPALLAALAAVVVAAGPAGGMAPSHIRTATLGGISGPVYYSAVDRRFHPVVSTAYAPIAAARVAENLVSGENISAN